MGVLQLTCRTLFRNLALRKGLLLLFALLLVLAALTVYTFTNYPLPSQSSKLEEEEQQLVRDFIKMVSNTVSSDNSSNDGVINGTYKSLPNSVVTADFGVPLQLSGEEEECAFSSSLVETRSDINVLNLLETLPYDNKDGGVWKQGYDISYDVASFQKEPLQVIVAPHSHNDPGWIKTFEDYYNQQTRNILNTVVNALAEDSRRKFIWAEISFFELWWNEQPADRRDLAKKLIANGQLEIVTGGWVMNDEANTHYFAMIDQLMEGHQWLQDNIGVKPVSGWAIDPFGVTPTMAYLLNRMGLRSMLVQRVHYAVKRHLSQQKQLEFLWRQGWDHGSSTDMLCHMMPFYSYDVPHTCGPDPKICCQFDFKRLPGSRVSCPWRIPAQVITGANVKERAELLLDQYRKKAQLYRTNVLLVPLGDDFRYDSSAETHDQYTNYQRIFTYYESHPELNVKAQFGTLNDYFSALRASTGVSGGDHPRGFPTLVGDFFTYADRDTDYWSGYYTSRPFYKNLDRVLEDRLRAAELLYSLARARFLPMPPDTDQILTKSRRSLGLFQHHDGITGTAKNHVVVDYGQKLLEAVNGANYLMMRSAQALLSSAQTAKPTADDLVFDIDETRSQHDSLPEKTVVYVPKDSERVIYLYNSLGHKRVETVSIIVDRSSVSVYDAGGHAVPCQVNPVMSSLDISSSKYELVFVATIGPLSLVKYSVRGAATNLAKMGTIECAAVSLSNSVIFKASTMNSNPPSFTITTDHLEAVFHGATGLLHSLHTKHSPKAVTMNIDFVAYTSPTSGAYLFLPSGTAQSIVPTTTKYCIIRGPLLHKVIVYLPIITHTVVLADSPGTDGQSLYISNVVDVRQETNKELVMKVTSSVKNTDRIYYTDLNGFQTVKRKTLDKLTTQGNFYPMPAYMFLQDSTTRLSLLSGQPLGVSSRDKGVLEVVLDRRLSRDDSRGLGHGVLDNKVTISEFRLLLEHRNSPDANPTRELAYPSLVAHHTSSVLLHPPHHFILNAKQQSHPPLAAGYTGLEQQLPCDIHMVNLRSVVTSSSRDAAMILHRRGFDCGFAPSSLTCNLTGGKLSVHDLFSDSPTTSQPMTLTMMHPRQKPTHIQTMEITTDKLTWSI